MVTRASRPEYHYVHPAVEPAGVELDFFELNGIDLTGMQGYANIFALMQTSENWSVPPPESPFGIGDPSFGRRVPRIEPSDYPPWIEPPDRFQ